MTLWLNISKNCSNSIYHITLLDFDIKVYFFYGCSVRKLEGFKKQKGSYL